MYIIAMKDVNKCNNILVLSRCKNYFSSQTHSNKSDNMSHDEGIYSTFLKIFLHNLQPLIIIVMMIIKQINKCMINQRRLEVLFQGEAETNLGGAVNFVGGAESRPLCPTTSHTSVTNWLIFSPFLFPHKKEGRRKGEKVSKTSFNDPFDNHHCDDDVNVPR